MNRVPENERTFAMKVKSNTCHKKGSERCTLQCEQNQRFAFLRTWACKSRQCYLHHSKWLPGQIRFKNSEKIKASQPEKKKKKIEPLQLSGTGDLCRQMNLLGLLFLGVLSAGTGI